MHSHTLCTCTPATRVAIHTAYTLHTHCIQPYTLYTAIHTAYTLYTCTPATREADVVSARYLFLSSPL
jgi:hypothetical protein